MSGDNPIDTGNPEAALAALTDPRPLTMARIALLMRIKSPVLFGQVGDTEECIKALWAAEAPFAEVVAHVGDAGAQSLKWAEAQGMCLKEYRTKLTGLLESLTAMWQMLPKGEPGEDGEDGKKKANGTAETDGSPSSPSGDAAPTGGALPL